MTCIRSFRNKRLFSKSTGLVLASHAASHGCFAALALFSTASRRASFLGVHPCARLFAAKHSHTSTYIHPNLGNSTLVSWDGRNCSFFSSSNNCSQIAVHCHKKHLLVWAFDPRCSLFHPCFWPHLPQISILPLPPYLFKLLLHFFLPQPVFFPKEDIKRAAVSSDVFVFCAPGR